MSPDEPASPAERELPSSRVPRLYAASLYCENCGEETPHRLLRLASVNPRHPGTLSGTARCRKCEWTHRFSVHGSPEVEVAQVISEGPRSVHQRGSLPAVGRVELGFPWPGSAEPLRVVRIETRKRKSATSARPEEIATVWMVRDHGAVVPVSVIEGARTWTDRLTLPHDSRLTVGEALSVGGNRLRIVALRARGRTWRLPEDVFVASDVQRIYARRMESPPAGRRPWRRGRGTSSSRERETSTSERSRSGPGARTT